MSEPKKLKTLAPLTVEAKYDDAGFVEIVGLADRKPCEIARVGNVVTFPPDLADRINHATDRIHHPDQRGFGLSKEDVRKEVAALVWDMVVWAQWNRPYLASVTPADVKEGERPVAEIEIIKEPADADPNA